jgi:hypothetical protein
VFRFEASVAILLDMTDPVVGSGSRFTILFVAGLVLTFAGIAVSLFLAGSQHPEPLTLLETDAALAPVGARCTGQLGSYTRMNTSVPSAVPVPDGNIVFWCVTSSQDAITFVLSTTPLPFGAPSMGPDLRRWLCGYLGGDYSLAMGPDYAFAIRSTGEASRADAMLDALHLHPAPVTC